MITAEEKETILDFVHSREQPGGGFSLAHTTPATIEDTYYAHKIFELLEVSYESDATKQYLLQKHTEGKVNGRQAYRILWLLKQHNVPENNIDLKLKVISSIPFDSRDIVESYYGVLARELLAIPLDEQSLKQIAATRCDSFLYVSEIARYVLLKKRLGLPVEEMCTTRLLRAQTSDGGFGFLEGTTSFMENISYALQGLHAVQATPTDLHGCEKFIQCCKHPAGGYGRQLHAVETLEATYHALLSLKILNEMKEKEVRNT